MKRILKSLLLAALTATPFAAQAQGAGNPDPNLHIYLCLGQSNMVGQAEILPEDTAAVTDRFLNLSAVNDADGRKVGEWRKAVPPICRRWSRMGPADFFGRTLLERLPDSVKVGLVHVGVNGCASSLFHKDLQKAYVDSIKPEWQRNEVNAYDGNPYQRLIDVARMAQQRGVIKGIIYHQGETDAYDDGWLLRLKQIYENLLSQLDLKAEYCPLLVGETARRELGGCCAHANPTIDKMHDWVPTAWTVSSEGCEVSRDGAHFSHAGYAKLGRRYAETMLRLEGFDIPLDGARLQKDTPESETQEPFSVTTSLNKKKQKLTVNTGLPMKTIEIVSLSGESVCTIRCNGYKVIDIGVKNLDEASVFLVVTSTDGKVVRRSATVK